MFCRLGSKERNKLLSTLQGNECRCLHPHFSPIMPGGKDKWQILPLPCQDVHRATSTDHSTEGVVPLPTTCWANRMGESQVHTWPYCSFVLTFALISQKGWCNPIMTLKVHKSQCLRSFSQSSISDLPDCHGQEWVNSCRSYVLKFSAVNRTPGGQVCVLIGHLFLCGSCSFFQHCLWQVGKRKESSKLVVNNSFAYKRNFYIKNTSFMYKNNIIWNNCQVILLSKYWLVNELLQPGSSYIYSNIIS